MKPNRIITFLFITTILSSACAQPISPPTSLPTPTHTSPTPPTLPPTLPPEPTATPAPPTQSLETLTAALADTPKINDWYIFNANYVDASQENDTLILKLKGRALWFMAERGVLVYQLVEGNFRITASVTASKKSDPTQLPEGPVVQLGGLMARNPTSGRQNYVFIVVGFDTNDLSVETKTTVDNISRWDGPSWGFAAADLRLCRFGSTFNLYKRPIGDTTWQLAQSIDRPDLPAILQVGPNIYSDAKPDLQVQFQNLTIEPITNPSECETT